MNCALCIKYNSTFLIKHSTLLTVLWLFKPQEPSDYNKDKSQWSCFFCIETVEIDLHKKRGSAESQPLLTLNLIL